MQAVEDFMREFFSGHIAFEHAKLAAYRPFRDRFFVDDYEPFSPHHLGRSCESEKIDSIKRSKSTATVSTSTVYRTLQLQFRYHLRVRAESWVIRKVEVLCKVCNGTGKFTNEMRCTRCGGKGWETAGT